MSDVQPDPITVKPITLNLNPLLLGAVLLFVGAGVQAKTGFPFGSAVEACKCVDHTHDHQNDRQIGKPIGSPTGNAK